MRIWSMLLTAIGLSVLIAAPSIAGSISGTVKYEGEVPKLRPIKMDAVAGCAKQHPGGSVESETLVLGEGKTMANILVKVKSGLPDRAYPPPAEPAVIDQHGCMYRPHVLGMMVGQKLKIVNSDGLLHNVHALPQVNKEFNRAMPATVTEFEHTFDKPEPPFRIKCDVHPWMGAFVEVLDHPFFAVTAKDGKYRIDGLPAGTYEIEAWHEKLPARTEKVTIADDESKTVDFTLSVPKR